MENERKTTNEEVEITALDEQPIEPVEVKAESVVDSVEANLEDENAPELNEAFKEAEQEIPEEVEAPAPEVGKKFHEEATQYALARKAEDAREIEAAEEESPVSTHDVQYKSYSERLAEAAAANARGEKRREERIARSSEVDELYDALYNHRMLTASINAVEPGDEHAEACIYYDACTVRIPFDLFYRASPIRVDDQHRSIDEIRSERITRELQFLRSLIGAEIQFMLVRINRERVGGSLKYEAVASRVAALEVLRKRYFGRNNSSISVTEGSVVSATILSVGNDNASLTCHGIDIPRLHKSYLTCRYVPDLRTLFHPGQRIDVLVTKISRDEEGVGKSLAVSHRSIEVDELIRKNLSRARPGSQCFAYITQVRVNENRSNTYFIYLDGIDLPAVASYVNADGLRQALRSGNKVRVRILPIRTNRNGKKYVECVILSAVTTLKYGQG